MKNVSLKIYVRTFISFSLRVEGSKWFEVQNIVFSNQGKNFFFFFLHVPDICNIFLCNGCKHFFIFKVILVQVNPGEAFTIRREDGQFQCITGKADKLILIFPESASG